VEKVEGDTIVFSTKIKVTNEGKQGGLIMDAILRTLLPFEQYDGIDARGKVEVESMPREDDYFEVLTIYPGDSDVLVAKVRLKARKGLSLKDAIAGMVDLPLDLIYTEVGRYPWRMKKIQFTLTEEEIKSLAKAAMQA